MYANATQILSKGHLPISLLPYSKFHDILNKVKKAIQANNPEYDNVIKRVYLYYEMKLVTFGINDEMNVIVQFPVFIQPYIPKKKENKNKKQLTMY